MLKKGFLTRHNVHKNETHRYSSMAGKSILFLGVFVLIVALLYMIVNLTRADVIFKIWLPSMIAGVFLVFLSQLVQWIYHHDQR